MQGGNKGSITANYSGIGLLIRMGLPAEWLHLNEGLAPLPGWGSGGEEACPLLSTVAGVGITLTMPLQVDCSFLI